ncbi:MAG: hypothetical protein KF773_21440 [Deltaproteobacteria bacterium]|nr:hypothetical protein [Deltaproteobacteria bacterium]
MFSFIFQLLPMLGVGGASADASKAHVEVISNPRLAQARLAEALGTADAIDSVKAISATAPSGRDGREASAKVVFEVRARGEVLRITAATRDGDLVASLVVAHAPVATAVSVGDLSWLADELRGATAVTTLAVDAADVTLGTHDGRRYRIMPGRAGGSRDHNPAHEAVEARWAAAWN